MLSFDWNRCFIPECLDTWWLMCDCIIFMQIGVVIYLMMVLNEAVPLRNFGRFEWDMRMDHRWWHPLNNKLHLFSSRFLYASSNIHWKNFEKFWSAKSDHLVEFGKTALTSIEAWLQLSLDRWAHLLDNAPSKSIKMIEKIEMIEEVDID